MEPSLGQYYTSRKISTIIANNFQAKCPNRLLELGAGRGTLISAVQKRWKKIEVISTDIDPQNFSSIKKKFPNGRHYCGDVIDDKLPGRIGLREMSVDIAVCNPPYVSLPINEKIENIFLKAGFKNKFATNSEITADLIFLAQNLRFLKHRGELGIILPDSYLCGHRFEWVREFLINEHCISSIIDLPEKVFQKTEAKTHILMLKKGVKCEKSIPILKVNSLLKTEDIIEISSEDGIYRMDYTYHKWKSTTKKRKQHVTLAQINAEIKRGSLSRKECVEKSIAHFHTTDFTKCDSTGGLSFEKEILTNDYITAEVGDILIARVGKRCIGKIGIVRDGVVVLSDCVYRVRVPEQYRERVFSSLASLDGKRWIFAHAHGVCSKTLSKRDLQNYKIRK